jgi:hypothetical protein
LYNFGGVKRPAAIFILFVMLFNGAGFYLYYTLELIEIRTEMRLVLKNAPETELYTLKLSVKEFAALGSNPDEIEYDGKMFDVARIRSTSDSVFVLCKHDEKEDSLVALLDYFVDPPLKNKTALPGSILQFLSLSYIIPANEFQLSNLESLPKSQTAYCEKVIENYQSPSTPPPWP